MRIYAFIVIAFLGLGCVLSSRTNNKKQPPTKSAPTTRLNVDILPPLQSVLDELELSSFLMQFVRMGITETRLLLRLTAMDFQIMMMDWSNFSDDHVSSLKMKIKELTELATEVIVPVREDIIARNKTIYGRIYMPNGVQSMEFNVASFGSAPPMGEIPIQLGKTLFECPSETITSVNQYSTEDKPYLGRLVIVVRGNCTFLQKALYLKQLGARGMLVVNTEDKLESLASGIGINKTVTETLTSSLNDFFVVAVANTSLLTLQKTVEWNEKTGFPHVNVVPLKCVVGGSCAPLVPEEQALHSEITYGNLKFEVEGSEVSHTVEFLTSNFGAPLPASPLFLDTRLVQQPHNTELESFSDHQRLLCEPISSPESVFFPPESNVSFMEIPPVISRTSPSSTTGGVPRYHAVLVNRGGCSFDTKAYFAQQAGYRLVVLRNNLPSQPLQRIGGVSPALGRIGIPMVLILPTETSIIDQHIRTPTTQLSVSLFPAQDDVHFDHWTTVAYSGLFSPSQSPAAAASAAGASAEHMSVEKIEEKRLQIQLMQQRMQGHEALVAWLQQQIDGLPSVASMTPEKREEL